MKPIVFDLYNTLIDESSVYKKFYSIISKKYELTINSQEFVKQIFNNQRRYICNNPKKSFKEITKSAYLDLIKHADPEDVNILFELYKEMDFFPNICRLLKKLKARLFILTNSDNDLIDKINLCSKCKVKFVKIFTSEDNGVYKPNSAAYQKVVDFIGFPAFRIIYVSSNKFDFDKAKEFGFDVKTILELKETVK